MEDILTRVAPFLGDNLPISLLSSSLYSRISEIESEEMMRIMNRYSPLRSLISVAIASVYENDIDTLSTLSRILGGSIDWNNISLHVNNNTNEQVIALFSYITGRDITPIDVFDMNTIFWMDLLQYVYNISPKDYISVHRYMSNHPSEETFDDFQRDIYYRILAKAIEFGWISVIDNRLHRDNIIPVFALYKASTIHKISYQYMKLIGLHPEWFASMINPHIRDKDVPDMMWRKLLPSAIAVHNVTLANTLIRKYKYVLTQEMKDKIIDISRQLGDPRITARYEQNLS